MTAEETIQAWKEPLFRNTLPAPDLRDMAPHPSGLLAPIRQEDGEQMTTPDCSVGMSAYCGCPP